jgi:hypothetical protein
VSGPGLNLVRPPSARELVCGLAVALPVFVVALVLASQAGVPAPWPFITALLLAVIGGGLGAALGSLWDLRAPRRRRRRRPAHRYPTADDETYEPAQAQVTPRLSARERGP